MIRKWGEFGALLVLFGGLLAAKFPYLIMQPRLHAEEGLFFLQNAVLDAAPSALFVHLQGYLNVLNGALALAVSAWVQPEYWAYAHQIAAFLVQVLAIGYIAFARLSFLPTMVHRGLFVAALALIPPSAETILTSTNMHFWAVVPTVCMLFDDATMHRTARRWGDAAAIGLAGLIGPPVAVFLPAMLLKALFTRTPGDRTRTVALLLVLIVHLASMAVFRAHWGDGPDRAIIDAAAKTLLILPWELIVGSVVLFSAGFSAAESVARAVSALPFAWIVAGTGVAYAAMAAALFAARRSCFLGPVSVSFVAIGGVIAGSLFSYPYDPIGSLSVTVGGRYTLLVSFVLLGLAAFVFQRMSRPRWKLMGPLVLLGLFATHAWDDRVGTPGPDWRDEVAAWRAGERSCGLRIEPEGWRIGIGEEFRARLENLVGAGKTPILERVADWRAENGMLHRPALGVRIFERLCREG